MPDFSYEAINEAGKTISGVIEAESAVLAEDLIASRGYIPLYVKSKQRARSGFLAKLKERTGKVKVRDLIIWTKQFKSMINAGVPIVRLLKVLEKQTQNPLLKSIAASISQKVSQGITLFDCLSNYPKVFSPLYCSMVRAGEKSGNLPDVLDRLIYIVEHEAKVKSEIKAALRYPMITLAALIGAFFVLMIFVLPKFAKMFEGIGLELPLPTRIAIGGYHIMCDYWYLLIGVPAGIIIMLSYILKTEEGKLARDRLLLKMPLFGTLLQKAAMARFASIFAILQQSGISVINALTILSGTIGNYAISNAFDKIKVQMKEGHGLAEPLKSCEQFTPMIIDMIAIGEESGNLEEMLLAMTKHYDDEVEYAVKGLSDAIGPVIMAGLAAMMGFFSLAVMMPMWDMTKMAS